VLRETNSTAATAAASSIKTTKILQQLPQTGTVVVVTYFFLSSWSPRLTTDQERLQTRSRDEADVSLPKEREIQTPPRLVLPADHSISSDIFD
jgi:hypothetical protein